MRTIRKIALALPAAAFLLAAGAAQGQGSYAQVKGMDERFRLDLGGFFQSFDTTLRLDSAALGRGTEINLEDDLGQDTTKTSFRASGYWRFGRHGRFDFGVITWSRSATKTITKDIEFGDHVYHAGATLDSRLTATQVDAYYAYSFVNTGEVELGAKLGFSAIFNSVKVEGTGSITGPGGTVSANRAADDRSVVAPVPAVGLYGRFTLLPGPHDLRTGPWIADRDHFGLQRQLRRCRRVPRLVPVEELRVRRGIQLHEDHVRERVGPDGPPRVHVLGPARVPVARVLTRSAAGT